MGAVRVKRDVSLLPLTNCFRTAKQPKLFLKCKDACLSEHAKQEESSHERQVSKVRQSSRRFQLPNVSRQVPAAELLHGWQGIVSIIHVDRNPWKTRKCRSSLANSD